jgi:hypothetical protein
MQTLEVSRHPVVFDGGIAWFFTNLGDEGGKAPWVVPQQDAAYVASCLVCAAQNQAPHEPPHLPFDAKIDVSNRGQCEKATEDDVGDE